MQQGSPFTTVQEPEIHTIRRVKILKKHPEIKKLMGYDTWSGILTLLLVFVQLIIAYFVGNYLFSWAFSWAFLLLSYFVGAVINHWLGMAIHEASHDLFAPKESQNRWLAIFANIPILVPVAMSFRRYHLKHHSHLGVEEEDNDFPTHWEARKIGKSPFKKLLWLSFYVFFLTMARGFDQKPNRWEWKNIAFIILTDLLIIYFLGCGAAAYLLLSTFFGYSLHPVAGHFIHEHFIFKEGQETYSYYGPLNVVNFNVGYHNEHHDFMNIPGRYLPKYHKITKEFYQDLESTNSWTWMYLKFIFSDKIGADSRFRRSEKVRKQGQKIARKLLKE